jgi:hypothetical protein
MHSVNWLNISICLMSCYSVSVSQVAHKNDKSLQKSSHGLSVVCAFLCHHRSFYVRSTVGTFLFLSSFLLFWCTLLTISTKLDEFVQKNKEMFVIFIVYMCVCIRKPSQAKHMTWHDHDQANKYKYMISSTN